MGWKHKNLFPVWQQVRQNQLKDHNCWPKVKYCGLHQQYGQPHLSTCNKFSSGMLNNINKLIDTRNMNIKHGRVQKSNTYWIFSWLGHWQVWQGLVSLRGIPHLKHEIIHQQINPFIHFHFSLYLKSVGNSCSLF